jgi:hypothetical protein
VLVSVKLHRLVLTRNGGPSKGWDFFFPPFMLSLFSVFDRLQVFINVPWWYLAANKVMSPFLTQRTKSKIVFCSPGKSAETLFRSAVLSLLPRTQVPHHPHIIASNSIQIHRPGASPRPVRRPVQGGRHRVLHLRRRHRAHRETVLQGDRRDPSHRG